jgi:hypothetical protein
MTKEVSRKFRVKRMHYHIRNMYEYAKQKGINLNEITEEEMEQFETRPRTFRENTWPLNQKGRCICCGQKTGYVDHVFRTYICSKECMDKIDARYLAGEEIQMSKQADDILEQAARDLFE